jgi:hypothetical protein
VLDASNRKLVFSFNISKSKGKANRAKRLLHSTSMKARFMSFFKVYDCKIDYIESLFDILKM